MSVECCGVNHDSRFCPECGKLLIEGDPLAWLLAHCRKQEKVNRTRADTTRDAGERDRGPGEDPTVVARRRHSCSRRAEGFEAKSRAWKARGDALAALVRGEDVR